MIVREPTAEDAASVLARVRPSDRAEIARLGGGTPDEMLAWHLRRSDCAAAFVERGVVLAISGVFERSMIDRDTGVPWMLGTRDLVAHRKAFLRETRRWVEAWATRYARLVVWAEPDDAATLRWLAWLGFEVTAREPSGGRGDDFFRMEMACRSPHP